MTVTAADLGYRPRPTPEGWPCPCDAGWCGSPTECPVCGPLHERVEFDAGDHAIHRRIAAAVRELEAAAAAQAERGRLLVRLPASREEWKQSYLGTTDANLRNTEGGSDGNNA